MYPTPNITGIKGIIAYSNTVTDGWFTIIWMLSVFIILFVIFKSAYLQNYRTSDIVNLSMFFVFLFGGMLWGSGLLGSNVMLIIIALFVASFIWAMYDE